MSVESYEQYRFEQAAHRAELRNRAVDDLGIVSLLPFTLGLVDLPEREPRPPSNDRALPGSREHGLGVVGIHQVIPRRPLLEQPFVQPDRAALGYAELKAA